MSWLRIAVLGLLGAACSVQPSPPPVAEPLPGEIQDVVLAEVVEEHVAAARAAPLDARLRGTLGLVYEANHIWPRAAAAFSSAALLEPDNPLWNMHAAQARYRAGFSEEADQLVRELVERFPDFAPARFRHAVLLLESGQVRAAQREFERCTELEPGFPESWISEAETLVLLDEPDRALERIERALAIAPNLQRAMYVRGLALQGLGRMDEASRDLERGCDVPRYMMPDALVNHVAQYAEGVSVKAAHAMNLVQKGRTAEALRFIEDALARRPNEVALLNTQAIILRRLDQNARALTVLQRARELEPGNLSTLSVLAGVCQDEGRFEQALDYSTEAVGIAPQNGRVRLAQGRALFALNRAQEARHAFEETILLDPTLSSARASLAECLTALGRHMDAEAAWKSAVKANPESASWLYQLGQSQIKLAKVGAARETLTRLRALEARSVGVTELVSRLSSSLQLLTGD